MELKLLGRQFTVKCAPGEEEDLKRACQLLEERLSAIQTQTGSNQVERLALLAALNLSHDLVQEKRRNAEYAQSMDNRIRLLQSTIEKALIDQTQALDKAPK